MERIPNPCTSFSFFVDIKFGLYSNTELVIVFFTDIIKKLSTFLSSKYISLLPSPETPSIALSKAFPNSTHRSRSENSGISFAI